MEMIYTTEEKLVHVEQAKVYVEEGKGRYTAYARKAGIAHTTFHDGYRGSRARGHEIIKLGKPAVQDADKGKFSVGCLC